MRFFKQFSKNTVIYESKWPSWADFLVFYDEFWRPQGPGNDLRGGQTPRKTAFLKILDVRAVRSETRFYAKMGAPGRVRPGRHGNGKRVYMKARYYIELTECSRL